MLVVLLLETEILNSLSSGGGGAVGGEGISAFPSYNSNISTTRSASRDGKGVGRGVGSVGLSNPTSLAAVTTLLVQVVDTLVLVHGRAHGTSTADGGDHGNQNKEKRSGKDQEGKDTVVEVLFDRVGEAGGYWAVR